MGKISNQQKNQTQDNMKQLKDYPVGDVIAARKSVASDLRALAHEIRQSDPYASHVSESDKERFLLRDLKNAEQVERGDLDSNLSIWQRINQKLTGETVALLN